MSILKLSKQTISQRRVAANGRNAKKSTGPHDTTSTRHNAMKHGLLIDGVTELDNPEAFAGLCCRLDAHYKPIGEVEVYFVRRIALCMVRVQRAARLEAESITATLNPPLTETTYPFGGDMTEAEEQIYGRTTVLDPGLPASLSVAQVEELQKFQRYETSHENKLYRTLAQLEALQTARRLRSVEGLTGAMP